MNKLKIVQFGIRDKNFQQEEGTRTICPNIGAACTRLVWLGDWEPVSTATMSWSSSAVWLAELVNMLSRGLATSTQGRSAASHFTTEASFSYKYENMKNENNK